MKNLRIYQNQSLQEGKVIALDEPATHHVIHVLRCNRGDALTIFDGLGHEFSATIQEILKRKVTVFIDKPVDSIKESSLKIHLGQAISRASKMDLAIQKAVELGVNEITPLITMFCSVKLSETFLQNRNEHWHAIIVNACQQCGRATLPRLNAPLELSAWLKPTAELSLVLDPVAADDLGTISEKPSRIKLLIGPEGGLHADEILKAKENGYKSISLGPRILRTETATVAAVSILQYRWGDLNH